MTGSLLAFVLISLFVIVTPGPDTALTVRNTLMRGRSAGIGTALGVSTGQMIWALATSAGLVALLLASEPVFNAFRLLGAAYLVWLGIQTLWAARSPGCRSVADRPEALRPSPSMLVGFRQGLLSDLSNPKMAAFFASILPQFAPQGQGMLSWLVLLGLVFSTMTLAWLSLYAMVIAWAGETFRRSRAKRVIEGLMGAALIAFGVRVACEQR
ncbi:MAG: LysE family translocator [Hyphomicrobiaceae bacterium]